MSDVTWVDDKPCPRCHSLDRFATYGPDINTHEVCAHCRLVYSERIWRNPETLHEFVYDDEVDAHINGWSRLRRVS